MFRYFGRNDIILIFFLVAGSIITALILYMPLVKGEYVNVYVDGSLRGVYLLSEDTTVDIEGYGGGKNVLVIEDGSAYIKEASCPDKLCVHQGRINKEGRELVCLPNRVVVRIIGKEDSEYDGYTQ